MAAFHKEDNIFISLCECKDYNTQYFVTEFPDNCYIEQFGV